MIVLDTTSPSKVSPSRGPLRSKPNPSGEGLRGPPVVPAGMNSALPNFDSLATSASAPTALTPISSTSSAKPMRCSCTARVAPSAWKKRIRDDTASNVLVSILGPPNLPNKGVLNDSTIVLINSGNNTSLRSTGSDCHEEIIPEILSPVIYRLSASLLSTPAFISCHALLPRRGISMAPKSAAMSISPMSSIMRDISLVNAKLTATSRRTTSANGTLAAFWMIASSTARGPLRLLLINS